MSKEVKITKDVEHAIKWLSAEFKFLKELNQDLVKIEQEGLEQQDKDLKKDYRVIRYIGRAERRVEKDIKEIVEEIKEAKKKETSEKKLNKLLDEIKVPSAQLLKDGSFYVGKLKDELKTIRTSVALAKKYPKEELRKEVKEEIGLLETDVKKLMVWITGLDAALKKAGKLFIKEDSKKHVLENREKLEKHLLDKPEDNDAWLVYADLLQTQGEPLGEYIMIMQRAKEGGLTSEQTERLAKISPKKLNGLVNCFFIEDFPDRYRLYNVPFHFPPHKGELHVVEWSKNKLPGARGQEDWLKHLKGKEWKLPDLYEINAVISALYNNRKHTDPIQRKLITDKFRKHLINYTTTCTRIKYNSDPGGKDIIWHNLGSKEEKKIEENIKGDSGILVSDDRVSEDTVFALLGTRNKAEVIKAYSWFNKVPFYIWRLTETPADPLIRVVWFDADSGWVGLNCDRHPRGEGSASGVKVHTATRFYKNKNSY